LQPSDWLASYRAGACAEVWSAMTELGPNVRDADLLGYAETVAAETMSRVRTNVELLVERLAAAGWHLPERSAASELQLLGEYNPLVVEALDPGDATPGWFYFALDEHHKANYSGGENYHVALPDPGADFRIQGLYGVDEAGEFFVSYLRATFEGGGFRGTVGGDEERSWTVPPDLELTRTLAAGLQPI
jgi:hypothetical protein